MLTTRSIPYTGTVEFQIWYRDKGTEKWIKGNKFTQDVSAETLYTYKDSVNDGHFVPGVHRINPYRVWKRVYNWEDGNLPVVYGSDATREYKFVMTGPLPLIHLNTIYPYSGSIDSNVNGLDGYALQKAYAKLRANQVGFGENLGEIRETTKMLLNPLESLRKFFWDNGERNLRDLKKLLRIAGRRGRGLKHLSKDTLRTASDTWLELRYGMYPLMKSVQDLIELANNQYATLLNTIYSVRSTKEKSHVWNGAPAATLDRGHASNLITSTISPWMSDYIGCHASVQYRVTSDQSLPDVLGVTPRFWPELAWELTRLSFVVDWWYDVGTWLGSFRFTPNVEILGNTVSTKVNRTVSFRGRYRLTYFPGNGSGADFTEGYIHTLWFDRVVNQDLPVLPHWKPDVTSLWHTIDAASLIVQNLLRKF
jgi:hypothetical protein